MKTKITLLLVLLVSALTIAQNSLNYKAIIKDDTGAIIANQNIKVEFKVLYGLSLNEAYVEEHYLTTNDDGLIILQIGSGIYLNGEYTVLEEVEWERDAFYLNVSIDLNDGAGLIDLGTTEFNAVPYASYAARSGNTQWKATGNDIENENTGNVKVTKDLEVEGRIKVGDDPAAPDPTSPGAIRFNEATQDFEGYNGTGWVSLTNSGSSGGWGSQSVNENEEETASDGDPDDNFGYSVSISGDYAIVGAYESDGIGAAYIFKKSGNTWTQQDKLTPLNGDFGDSFGFSVSISGNYAVIGSSEVAGSGPFIGSAYVFVRSGSNWTQQAKLTASDATPGDYFGYSVSISGDTVVVGAPRDDDNVFNSGSLYIYQRSGSIWSLQAKLNTSNPEADDYLGASVSISGNYIIAGAIKRGATIPKSSAYIFEKSGGSWTSMTETIELIPADILPENQFGVSVSISGNYAIVGAYYDNTNGPITGSAYVYYRSGNTWIEQAKLLASDISPYAQFGQSVSISQDTIIVGALTDGDPNGFGAAYIYNRAGTIWSQQAKLTASDAAAGDLFGTGVAISNNNLIVGAPNTESGSVYFFNK